MAKNYEHTCSGAGDRNYSRDEQREHSEVRRVGALGFGLNQEQQDAIADLWDWHERSSHSKLIIGGPLTPERKELIDQIYKTQSNG
jgi:putative AlgH/UPF0301 family transcriptional regulator